MISFESARDVILRSVRPLGVESIALAEAAGRVLAADVIAKCDLPLFDNSAMDGFAVRAADCAEGRRLQVAGSIAAGEFSRCELAPETAIRIMTGAPIPAGCDAVIPFERCVEEGGAISSTCAVVARQHIRFAGEDVKRGEVIVRAHSQLRAPEIGILASLGDTAVRVFRMPRVAIVSTGDELVEVGDPLAPNKIVNSNSQALAAAVKELDAIPVRAGIARDNVESHRALLSRGLEADALITSAGVSGGDRDLVREVLAELGVEHVFSGVDVQPGGPTAFGCKGDKPVFSLPGNPVAALLMFEVFVRPALMKIMGYKRIVKRTIGAALQEDVKKAAGKVRLMRVKLVFENGRMLAHSAGDQNTGIFKTLLRADGIAILAAERTSYARGEEVQVLSISDCSTMVEPNAAH